MRIKTKEEIKEILEPGPTLRIAPPTLRYNVEQAMRRAYRSMDKEVLANLIPQNRAEARRHLRGRGPWGLARTPK